MKLTTFFLSIIIFLSITNGVNSQSIHDSNTLAKKTYKEKISERRQKIRHLFLNEDPNAVDAYTHGFLWGLGIKTNGWKMTFRWLRTINPVYSYHVLASLSEINHHKERTRYLSDLSGYLIDGKTDLLYPIHLGVGINRYIVNKASNNGIFIQAFGTGGLILGFQKPYNLEVLETKDNKTTSRLISYENDDKNFYNGMTSTGLRGWTVATFFHGWDKLTLNPGLFVEAGARIGISKRKGFMTTINVGLGLDYFPTGLNLMINEPSDYFILHFFASFEIGNTKMKK